MNMEATTPAEYHFSTEVPAWIIPGTAPASVNASERDLSDGVMHLLVDRQANFVTNEFFYHFVTRITAAVGLQNNTGMRIEFSPEYERVVIHRVGITRGVEYIDRASPDRLKVVAMDREDDRFIYSGMKCIDLHIEDARVGDVIEYSYTLMGRNPVYGGRIFSQNLLGYATPVGLIRQLIIVPRRCALTVRLYGTDAEPVERINGNEIHHEIILRDTSPVAIEDLLPSWHEPLPFYCASEFTTWEDLARWARDLFMVGPDTGPALADIVAEIRAAHADAPGRIRAALTFVQNEVRYLADSSGIYGYKPFPPEAVLKRRFGDCKDKSLLLCCMLRAMGITAAPALVHTQLLNRVMDRPPIPFAFNHCVVRILHEGREFWYDPTIFGQGGDYDAVYFPDVGKALLLDDRAPGLVDVPYRSTWRIRIEETFTLGRVDEGASLDVLSIFEGGVADDRRLYFERESLSTIEKQCIGYYSNLFGEIASGPDITTTVSPDGTMLTVHESYRFVNPWKPIEGNDKMKKIGIVLHGVRGFLTVPSIKERRMPIWVPDRLDVEHHITMTCGQSVPNQEIRKTHTACGIENRFELLIKDNLVRASSTLTTGADVVPADQTGEYIKFMDDFLSDTDYILQLRHSGTRGLKDYPPQLVAVVLVALGFLLLTILTQLVE